MAETTDDDLRYEFLRLLAQEGRLHFMGQIAESKINDSAAPNAVPGLPQQRGN